MKTEELVAHDEVHCVFYAPEAAAKQEQKHTTAVVVFSSCPRPAILLAMSSPAVYFIFSSSVSLLSVISFQ